MAEKTEKATPKKLRDARKKGQVAKSQDFPSAFTFIVSISAVLLMAGYLFMQLSAYLINMFKLAARPNLNLTNIAPGVLKEAMEVIFNCSLPILLLTVCTGILISFLTVGPTFSSEVLKPDLKRLNPVTNIKNLFKMKTLFELMKSVFKILGAFILIWTVVYGSIPEIVATAALPALGSAAVFSSFLIKVIVRVGIFFIAVAVADLVFQRRNFAKEMRMEKFEVKREYRDTEGDPQMKSRRRQIAQEIAYQEGPAAAGRARAIITNPIHIAVALTYNDTTDPAPRIVTMGKGPIADKIVMIALEKNIPIMRNVELAQTLFEKGEISDYIPEETYQAVSEILKWIQNLEAQETANLELFKQ
jgi:type III secretion YscU/HrpY family protein